MGLEKNAPGRGRKPVYGPEIQALIVEKTLRSLPPQATQWSQRSLAKALDLSDSTVGRVWRAHGLKPHLVKTLKVSNDPRFVEKLEDVIGLYLNAPEHALVLCCDEESQVQALDRTQPGLPLKKGRAGTMTHDYVRHGTTTLFAALNVADGTLIGQRQDRHRHQEWLKFLQQIDAETPADRDLHLILDNYATHKHPKVKKWIAKHPRFQFHFTPTRASWLNMVERFFRDLTVNRLRRDVFHSVPGLVAALEKCIAQHNRVPKPFIWTGKANDILAKVARAREKLPCKKNVTVSAKHYGSNGFEALEQTRLFAPDVLLLDLRMPGLSSVEVTQTIRLELPRCRIIIVTTYDWDEDIYRTVQAGASSYLLKDLSREELLAAIRAVHHGHDTLPTEVAGRLEGRFRRSNLSARELEVIELLVKGNSNKEIAAAIYVCEETVKGHLKHLFAKLGVNDRTQAVIFAIQHGIVHLA